LRHYGILSNRNRKTALKKCQELLEFVLEWMDMSSYEESVIHLELIFQKCPCCETGRMLKKENYLLQDTNPQPVRLTQ
jgi:hypothetical protein